MVKKLIRAVLFDIDGVLIDSRKANVEFFKDLVFRVGGKSPSKDELNQFFSATIAEMTKHFYPSLTSEEVEKACDLGLKLYPNFYRFMRLEKHVKEVLMELKEKYRLGIVTSRLSADVLDHFKLSSFFQVFITAQDYTYPKPHPEPLLMAIKRLRIIPQKIAYVGDAKSDEGAAKNASVIFIAYKNKSLKTPHHFSDFRQLPEILEKIFQP